MIKVAIITLGGLVLALSGCSGGDSASTSSILGNPTPELFGMTERYDDSRKNMAVMANNNSRMFWEDAGRAMYYSHPSRLTPLPMVFTSGKAP